MTRRALVGDAPSWIKWSILATFLGLTGLLVLYFGVVIGGYFAFGWFGEDWPLPPGIIVSVAVVAVLVNMLRMYLAKRPLDWVDRRYYRLGTGFIGLYGLMGTWYVGAVMAALMLLHSFFIDRGVRPTEGTPPITKEYREWLERGGDRR